MQYARAFCCFLACLGGDYLFWLMVFIYQTFGGIVQSNHVHTPSNIYGLHLNCIMSAKTLPTKSRFHPGMNS